jgi:hypothetical protein
VGFHGSARHFELAGNFGVVAALQEKFDDLLLAGSQSNGLLRHPFPPVFGIFG